MIRLGRVLSFVILTAVAVPVLSQDPASVKPTPEAVLKYLHEQDYAHKWHRFPGNPPRPKRLGLPVHGRWIDTFVNDTALNYIKLAMKGKVQEPLDFPDGSFIVKQNFPGLAPPKKDEQPPVLTVMFKPAGGFCATPHLPPYNGKDCLGGEWFWTFLAMDQKTPLATRQWLQGNVNHHVNSFCINCHAPAFNTDYVRTLREVLDPFTNKVSKQPYCEQFTQSIPTRKPKATRPREAQQLGRLLHAFCNPTKLIPNLPGDVPIDPTLAWEYFGSEATQEMFNCLAWKTFVALNWENVPLNAETGWQRGVPDKDVLFTATRTRPTVWETFKPTYEVFQPNDAKWNPSRQPWNQPTPAIDCKNELDTSGQLVLTMVSKSRDVVNETGQAFAGTFGFLVDRNRRRVRYEVLFNRTEFEYLIGGNRATTSHLTPSGPATDGKLDKISFPDNHTDKNYKVGAIEIKSAWKELAIGPHWAWSDAKTYEEAIQKFYVRANTIYEAETGTCRVALMGLVGLHIAHKTHFAPQWVWMTFEHRDNVPVFGQQTQATFYNPDTKVDPDKKVAEDYCSMVPFLASPYPLLFPPPDKPQHQFCPNVDLNRFYSPWLDQPNQITRLDPRKLPAKRVTARFHELMKGSPFANYILISTQWPLHGRNKRGQVNEKNCVDNGIDEDCFTMLPRYLRNTSMESFMSTYCEIDGRPKQVSNRSCMGCHGKAGNDFSFLWLDAVSQRVRLKSD